MLQNRDIVCISSIDWDFIWQGHQQIMSTLAEHGNRVLFIENTGVRAASLKDLERLRRRVANWWRSTKGFRQERENLFVYAPLVLPFPYSRIARMINRRLLAYSLKRWMRAMEFSRPILWTFLPTPLALDLIRVLDPKVTVYYCIDNFAVSSSGARKVARSETELMQCADLVFVTSQHLYERACRFNERTEIFPFGVDLERFEHVRALPEADAIPEPLRRLPRPIAGYVGGIHKWLDQPLVAEVAQRLPHMSFVFVGPIQTDVSDLRRLPNVHFVGKRSHEEIPHYVRAFDVGLIPYLISSYTDHVYPTKLNEYLAMGKPVVSTELEEIKRFNRLHGDVVRVGRDAAGFGSGIVDVVRANGHDECLRRITTAERNSWPAQIERMCGLIEERVELVERSSTTTWQERLLAVYRGSRSRLVVAALALAVLYAVIFESPLLWYAASPLAIVDPPRRADAVVVFAGGVGESGLAGEGYQERVKHAASLFHAQYARHVVFSSGYYYLFKEAQIMKAFAVSLGVPPSAILLEEKAANTYQNVTFVRAILAEQGWTSILLVSSPYHMRRASLTFRRVAPEITVVHTPVPESRFYQHRSGVTVRQISAIAQEYAAILYYWWKGHI